MSDKKDNGYDDSLIDEVIAILEDEGDRDMTVSHYNRIQNAVKEHCFYDRDETDWDDVENYIDFNIDVWERRQLFRMLGVNEEEDPHPLLAEVEINTLDDECRMELLMKLYKSTTNIAELEKMIRASHIEKLNNTIL